MLSSLSICRTSGSLHLLLQKLLQPCATGPYLLLPRHGLSQKQRPIFSVRSGGESQQRDGALKCFVRFLTDGRKPNPTNGGGLQILTGSKEDEAKDGEVKLRQGAAKNARVKTKKLKEEGTVHSPWDHADSRSSLGLSIAKDPMRTALRVTIFNTDKNVDPAAEARKKVNVAQIDSEPCGEVYSVVIRRKLKKKFLQELRQKLEFLHSASLPLIQLSVLLKKSRFLSASSEELVTVVHVLTECFEPKSIALAVLTANPGILAQPIDTLKQRLRILTEFEVDREACIKLGTHTGMWTLQPKRYEERLSVLKEAGLDAQARNRLIRHFPRLMFHTESSLRAKMEFLESIGLHGSKLLRFVKQCPRGFSCSVNKSLMVKLNLVKSWGLSVNAMSGALNFLMRHSKERIALRYTFFREQGLSHEAVIKIFRLMPNVLSKSTESLKVRLDFLVHELNRDILEVATFPPYLGYSFEGRIVPRFRALETLGLSKITPLASALSGTVSEFKRRYNIPNSVKCD